MSEGDELAKSCGWKSMLDALEKNLDLLKESERQIVNRWSILEQGTFAPKEKEKETESGISAQKGFDNGSRDCGT